MFQAQKQLETHLKPNGLNSFSSNGWVLVIRDTKHYVDMVENCSDGFRDVSRRGVWVDLEFFFS